MIYFLSFMNYVDLLCFAPGLVAINSFETHSELRTN